MRLRQLRLVRREYVLMVGWQTPPPPVGVTGVTGGAAAAAVTVVGAAAAVAAAVVDASVGVVATLVVETAGVQWALLEGEGGAKPPPPLRCTPRK